MPPRRLPELTDQDYEALAQLRHGQRRFQHWSAEQAAEAGLTTTQHQLLLGVRAWRDPVGPTVGDVATFLFIRHHSAVELVDRAERAELVRRRRGPGGSGQVIVEITEQGAERLRVLTESHLRELAVLAPRMSGLWDAIGGIARENVEMGPSGGTTA